MKFKQVKVGGVINLGEYSDIRPEVTVEVEEGESVAQATEAAMDELRRIWSTTDNKQLPSGRSSGVQFEKMKCYLSGAEVDFDPVSHTYYVGEDKLMSGSTWAEQFVPKFDKAMILPKSAAKLETTPEEVDAYWQSKADVSTTFGTALHQALEHYGKYKELADKDIDTKTGKSKGLGIHPSLAPIVEAYFEGRENEVAVYEPFIADLKNLRCGQVDRVVITGDKKCVIHDYKTNGDLFKQGTPKTLKSPYTFLPNQPIGKYALQLSFYKAIFEAHGWEVEGLIVDHWTGEVWEEIEVKPVLLDQKPEPIDLSKI